MKSSLILLVSLTAAAVAAETDYTIVDVLTASSPAPSRSPAWKPAKGLALEVSGMDWTHDGRLAVAIRKGEVWLLNNIHSTSTQDVASTLFASGLHEPLGLLQDGDSLLVAQRTELTRLRDTNGDDLADEYLTFASGWNVSGAYHGYTYGPKRDGRGRLWLTLNLDLGERADNNGAWRGWSVIAQPDGSLLPMTAGLRSPCGLGPNRAGDMFCVDQQGNWIPATPVFHLRKGIFCLNPDGIASQTLPGSPLKLSAKPPGKMPYPNAVRALPEMVPPAAWLPYNKMGRSGTDLVLCDQDGQFGPFDGQFLVAEFTDAKVNRLFLERVDGEYQGAAFPFLSGFASGVVRLLFGKDGNLFVGMTSRGWSSLGTKSYGLQRVQWNRTTAFALLEMRALPDGFELVFTENLDQASAVNPAAYALKSYTYLYSSAYGSDEIDTKILTVSSAIVSDDPRRVRLKVDGLRELYVHELRAEGVLSSQGAKLLHPDAYYTLNRIPRK